MKKVLCVLILLTSYVLQANPSDETERKTGGEISRLNNEDVSIQLPHFIFSHTNTRVVVKFANAKNYKLTANNRTLNFIVNGNEQPVVFDEQGVGSFYYTFKAGNELKVL